MPTLLSKPFISVDGNLSDWIASERIDYGDAPGYSVYAQAQGDYFLFALSGPLAIGPNTTAWFNTDLNGATGYLIWGWAGGAEYNLNIKSDGTAALYTGGAGQTLVLDNIQLAYSSNHQSVEFAIPKGAVGNPGAIATYYDINDSVFVPVLYAAGPYVAYNETVTPTDPTHRIGIVYSATTAAHYFSATAYADLIMAAQSQAMQAGIPFDLLTESDLSDLAKLVNYDALVFPSFSHLQASDVTPITDTLLQATKQFGIGLITSGNFMTNDQTGAALPGDSYARMKLLFDAMRVTGGFPADVTIKSSDANHTVFTTMDAGAVIRSYTGAGWDTFESVSGTGQTIATETIGGQTYTAALATQTGGRNVLFSTASVMADSNLLWQAIDYVANDPGVSVGLNLTRFAGIVASRTDMDEAMETAEVSPEGGGPGMYDKMIPILQQWKQQFNFVGSYYVDIGNDPANEQMTDWAVSAPYYAQLLALGNELGTHSYTHPADTNFLTPAQIQFEFQQSKLVLEQQMSAYLGHPFTIEGAAVPGMPEGLPTSQQIIQYFNYITGGAVLVGAGYPGAFGFLTPDLTDAVYLAPNTSFDFTLIEWQQHTPAEAEALWAQEWNALVANANTPIVLWPWHDYGVTQWSLFGATTSPYTLEMFTNWIQRAYQSGAEFVTEADLASRIQSFVHSGVTSTVNGNVINVTVSSADAGDFALDVAGQGSQVIANVGSWYAYDSDSLFLPVAGGSFTITLGGIADDVTHITALPMRGDLLSVTGDGLNLDFAMFGEGQVVIDLGQRGNTTPVVTGATIASLTGDLLTLTLTGLSEHAVSLRMGAAGPPAVDKASFSADTGPSTTDFITSAAAQTISGTLSAALGTGDVVKVSLDNGASWLTATAAAGATTFSLAGVALTGSNTLIARVENAAGTSGTVFSRAYVLDQIAPTTPTVPDLLAASDSGVSNADNITNVTNPTLTGTAEAGSTIILFDGTTQVGTGITTVSGTWFATTSTLAPGTHSITAKAADPAGNASAASAALAVTISGGVLAPSAPDLLAASDSGASTSDNITNVTRPTLTGTAAAGSTVTLHDGSTTVGTGVATATGNWTVTTASTLASGGHSITAKAADAAGNVSVASAVLSITIDTLAPATPSVPDLIATSDSGKSTTDNITSITTPTFSGTAAAGSTVSLFDGTNVIGTGVVAGGKWTITALSLANGIHSISTKAADQAGNVSAASNKLSVTIDTVAPNTPAFTAITASGTSLTLTGSGDASTTVAILNGATQLGTTTVGTGGTWGLSFSSASSVRTLTGVESDVAGNKSPTTSGSVLVGTSSANTLTSTAGNELLFGGGGADTFSFASLFGRDIIADFTASGTRHDLLNFRGNSVLNNFANVMGHAVQVGSGVVITQDASNVLTLSNVTRSSLAAADFTFA